MWITPTLDSKVLTKLLGHLQTPQPRIEGQCQCCEGVSPTLCNRKQLLIRIRMLYDFHQKQNLKKPGTIHATYLLSGTKRPEDLITLNEPKKDGEDEYMQSSPFMSSSMPLAVDSTGESSLLSITLVKEEDLEG